MPSVIRELVPIVSRTMTLSEQMRKLGLVAALISYMPRPLCEPKLVVPVTEVCIGRICFEC